MSITKKRMNQIVKEELNRALKKRGLNEGGYGEYYIGSDPDMRAQADHDRDEHLSRWERDQALSARKSMNPQHREPHPMTHHYEKQFAELDDYIATGRLPRSYAEENREMNEMMDPNYNDDLQSRLGRFTTPENVKGTSQYGRGPSSARKPEPGIYYPQDYTPPGGYGGGGGGWDYSEYDHLREADDDMDADMGIDVVPDDEMGGEEDMGMPMSGEEMEPVATEIDWSQFEDEDTDVVGVAFFDALKQLREESPDEEPTAESVVALMQTLLAGDAEEDMDDMGGEEMEDEAEPEEEESMGGDEEGALNEWVRRTNLLAGTSKRR